MDAKDGRRSIEQNQKSDTDLRIHENINDQKAINNQCGNDEIQ